MTTPKVLIAAPVNSHKAYCIPEYLESCKQLTYSNKDFYFVDNSEDQLFHVNNFLLNGWDCDHVSSTGLTNQEYICKSQQLIGKKVLDEGYDYLFMCEIDIFPPKHIIQQMLSHQKPIVAANYFIGGYESTRLMKMGIEEKNFGLRTNRNISNFTGFLESGTNKTQSKIHGLGCTLIHSSILKKYPFHLDKNSPEAHADITFYMDLNEDGVEVTVHPMIVTHKNSSWHKISDAWV